MTLDPLMSRERIYVPPRPKLSPAAKRRIWDAHNGICWWCNTLVALEMSEFDHTIARELSADDSDENLAPMHFTCHAAKTKGDRARITKAHRQEKLTKPKEQSKRPIPQRDNPWPTGRKIQNRPFPSSRKD